MGYLPQPTPEMDGFHVETRGESFHLRGRMWMAHQLTFIEELEGRPFGSVELAYTDIPAIRAALDQAERIHRGAHS